MPHRRAVVGRLVSGRRAGRRQLHRAAHAGVEVGEGLARAPCCSSTSRITCCGPGRGFWWRSLADCFPAIWPTSRRRFRISIRNCSATTSRIRRCSKFLPVGFIGLMVGGLIAANSSTILTHLNWGASYLVHDFYRRFIQPRRATRSTTCCAGRLATVGLFVCAVGFGVPARLRQGRLRHHPAGRRGHRPALSGALVLVARERVVRSRRDDQLVRRVGRAPDRSKNGVQFSTHVALMVTVALTTVCWVATAYLGPETDRTVLVEFYRKVRPAGPGWASIRREANLSAAEERRRISTCRWRCSAGRPDAR